MWTVIPPAGCRMLGFIVLCWAWVALHVFSWNCGAFPFANLVVGTWVIVIVVVAVFRETWVFVTSFKLVWWASLLILCSVAALVVLVWMWKCKKLGVGTTVSWDRKLSIVEARPSFGIETESCLKAGLSFCVSDFRGIMKELTWLLCGTSLCMLLSSWVFSGNVFIVALWIICFLKCCKVKDCNPCEHLRRVHLYIIFFYVF